MPIEATSELQEGMVIFGQSLEILRPFANTITFGIDVAATLIIGISALFRLVLFENTNQIN